MPVSCCNKKYRNIRYNASEGLYTWEEVITEPVYRTVPVKVGEREIYRTIIEYENVQVPKTGTRDVTEYQSQTITTVKTTSTNKNDTTLLNKGYVLTGVTEVR